MGCFSTWTGLPSTTLSDLCMRPQSWPPMPFHRFVNNTDPQKENNNARGRSMWRLKLKLLVWDLKWGPVK